MSKKRASPDDLKAFGRCIASSVFVVTAFDENGEPHGATICSGTSLSLQPAMVLICLDYSSRTLAALRKTSRFRLHVLAADQSRISQQFASKEQSKRQSLAAAQAEGGAPMLEGVVAAAECRAAAEYPGGDHAIVIGEIESVTHGEGQPLVYHRGIYADLAPRQVPQAAIAAE